jgi:hypothetical protein
MSSGETESPDAIIERVRWGGPARTVLLAAERVANIETAVLAGTSRLSAGSSPADS